MANVALFKQGKIPEYLQSVNTPDYSNDPDALINPDISAVLSVPKKYWKRNGGNRVLEMNASEKAAIDNADLQVRKNNADTLSVSLIDAFEVVIMIGNQKWSKGQTVTREEVITLLKSRIV